MSAVQQSFREKEQRKLVSSYAQKKGCELWSRGEPRKIAIVRALQLGDLLVSVPAWRSLRQRFPQAEITLIGLPWAQAFVHRYRDYIDRFVEFAGYPGIPEAPFERERTQSFLVEQRAYGYDLVIQMHGSGRTSNPLALEFQAPVTLGYYEQELPAGLTLGAPYPQRTPEVLLNLGLAELAGCKQLDPHLEFPLYPEDFADLAAVWKREDHPAGPWIGIHPGSRPPARRWPPEYFAAIADELIQRFAANIVFTGSKDEMSTVQAVIGHMQGSALNLVGQTSLGALGALISKLDLFISNDTGPAHIAAAFTTPSVTIFGPADYTRWAPLEKERHAVVRHKVACSPCGFWTCPIDHRCLRGLAPASVTKQAEYYLLQKFTVQRRKLTGV